MAARKPKQRFINLLPQKEFESSLYGRVLKWVLSTFRFIVVAVEVVVIGGFLSRFVLDVRNTDLQDEIDQKKIVIDSFAQVEREFLRIQKKLEIFQAYASDENSSSWIFERIIARMPPDLRLSSITIEDGKIAVLALGANEQAIAQFIANLNDEAAFEKVLFISSESNKDDPFIRFQLDLILPSPAGSEP